MSLPNQPVTRIEKLLAKIVDGGPEIDFDPQTRVERYLAKIAGIEASIPKRPITRIERYLAYLAGDTSVSLPTPVTRIERYLAAKAGTGEKPETPITRVEMYLDEWTGGDAFVYKTVSGAIVSVTDALAGPVKALKVNIEPVQEGEGDPSPENVRQISGWNGVTVTVSPTADAQDGKTYSVTFPDEVGTVYGGTLDVTTGVLVVDKAFYAVNTISRIRYGQVSGFYYVVVTDDLNPPGINSASSFSHIISDKFLGKNGVVPGHCYITAYGKSLVAVLPDQTITTSEEAQAWFDANPTTFVYDMAAPQTYQLTPEQVRTLLGSNNIWADAGDVEVTYRADPSKEASGNG